MSPRVSIDIDVAPTANTTVRELQKQAMRQLTALLGVDSDEEAAKLVGEVDFNIYTDGFVEYANGDIVGKFPIYRATLHAQMKNEKDGYYSGRLF